jgi:serine/threonine protein kinase
VLRALRAAHAAGVLHRDVKPGNVLLSPDRRVLLTDFGIAQVEGDTTITRTGEIVGSVDYLAPERVRGHDPGPASDLWALGATLYTAVEGRSPFRRTSALSTMQAVVDEELTPPQYAGALEPVITALLRKDPAGRPGPQEAEEMLAEAAEGRRPRTAQAYVPTSQASYDFTETGTGTGTGGTRAQTAPATPYPPVTIAPVPAPPKRHRLRTFTLVVALATIIGGGVAVALQHFGTGGPGGSASGSSTRSADARPSDKPSGKGSQGAVPAGWERHTEVGFSISLPKGWKSSVSIDQDGLRQVDYSPDKGKHLVRVAVDTAPDFSTSYDHMTNLDGNISRRLRDYRQLLLKEELFRDQPGARWEYTWDALAKDPPHYFPGPYHAIDVGYMNSDGTEYAVYESSPADEWTTTKKQFDTILRSFQEG